MSISVSETSRVTTIAASVHSGSNLSWAQDQLCKFDYYSDRSRPPETFISLVVINLSDIKTFVP